MVVAAKVVQVLLESTGGPTPPLLVKSQSQVHEESVVVQLTGFRIEGFMISKPGSRSHILKQFAKERSAGSVFINQAAARHWRHGMVKGGFVDDNIDGGILQSWYTA